MDFVADIGGFLLKAAIIVVAVGFIVGLIAQAAQKQKRVKVTYKSRIYLKS